jgi:hypothetical protein
MKNIRMGVKLVGGFALVAAITLVVGIVGLYGVSTLIRDLAYIGDNRIPDLQHLATLNQERMVIRAQTLEVWAHETDADGRAAFRNILEQRRESWRIIEAAWNAFLEIPRQTDRGREILNRLQNEYEAWRKIYAPLDALVEQISRTTNPSEKASLFEEYHRTIGIMVPISDAMGGTFVELTKNNNENTDRLIHENTERSKTLRTAAIVAMLLGTIGRSGAGNRPDSFHHPAVGPRRGLRPATVRRRFEREAGGESEGRDRRSRRRPARHVGPVAGDRGRYQGSVGQRGLGLRGAFGQRRGNVPGRIRTGRLGRGGFQFHGADGLQYPTERRQFDGNRAHRPEIRGGRPSRGAGRFPDDGRHAEDRREDIHHRGDRPADRSAGPQRGHRGGPGRGTRQGLRRGGLRSPQAGRAQPEFRRRDRQALQIQRGSGRAGRSRRSARPAASRIPGPGRSTRPSSSSTKSSSATPRPPRKWPPPGNSRNLSIYRFGPDAIHSAKRGRGESHSPFGDPA